MHFVFPTNFALTIFNYSQVHLKIIVHAKFVGYMKVAKKEKKRKKKALSNLAQQGQTMIRRY